MTAAAPSVQEIADALRGLLVATKLWARRRPLDEASVARAQDGAVELLHRHYLAHVPVYRLIAEDAGLLGPVPAAMVARELMVTDELFKSYDPHWLDGDFGALTQWLRTIFVRPPGIDAAGCGDVEEWRARLRADGVFVTCSSGTSGRPSFVPRDRMTVTALRRNGQLYAPETAGGELDCLLVTGRGLGLGIEAVARGLADGAARAEWLDPTADDADAAWAQGIAFLRAAAAAGRRALVFGAPPALDELCDRADAERLPAPAAGSLVVTGGGWKTAAPGSFDGLRDRAVAALGVAPERVVDIYGAAELNAYLLRCGHDRYHVPPLLRPVVLDDLLEPVEADEAEGLLGFLDLFALSYPGFVIPGDTGRLLHGVCACGLTGWALAGPIRRAPRTAARGCAQVAVPR